MRHWVTAELVGDQHPKRRVPPEEFAEGPLGGLGVAPARDEDVEDVAVDRDGNVHSGRTASIMMPQRCNFAAKKLVI